MSPKKKLLRINKILIFVLLIDAVVGVFVIDPGFIIFVLFLMVVLPLFQLVTFHYILKEDGSLKELIKLGSFEFPFPLYYVFTKNKEKRRVITNRLNKVSVAFSVIITVILTFTIFFQILLEIISKLFF